MKKVRFMEQSDNDGKLIYYTLYIHYVCALYYNLLRYLRALLNARASKAHKRLKRLWLCKYFKMKTYIKASQRPHNFLPNLLSGFLNISALSWYNRWGRLIAISYHISTLFSLIYHKLAGNSFPTLPTLPALQLKSYSQDPVQVNRIVTNWNGKMKAKAR